MTLDEAIERYKDNAEYERTHSSLQGCLEFKQLVEWLKELKQLRKRQSVIDKAIAEIDGLLNDEDNSMYVYGVMDCLEIIDKYRAKSEG